MPSTIKDRLMWAFAKAVLIGTLVGGALPLLLTVPLAIDPQRDLANALLVAALPLFLSFSVVLVASTFIGIPVFLLLRSRGAETMGHYVGAGYIAGAAIAALVVDLTGAWDGLWLCLFGGLSGAATAATWARSREKAKGVGKDPQAP